MTPIGIEPATYGLAAQCRNQLRYRVHGKWKQVYDRKRKLHEAGASPGVVSEKHDSWQKSRLERQKTYGKFGLRETAAVNNTH
jgi:hypothetical protein